MERWIAKVISNILVFIVLTGCTALPIKVAPFFKQMGNRGQYLLSLIMCFGGGILLSTYLLQMIPEIRHILERTLLRPNDIHYPLPELFTACGFFFLVFLEKLVVSCDRKGKKQIEYDIEIVPERKTHDQSCQTTNNNVKTAQMNGEHTTTHLNGNGSVVTVNGNCGSPSIPRYSSDCRNGVQHVTTPQGNGHVVSAVGITETYVKTSTLDDVERAEKIDLSSASRSNGHCRDTTNRAARDEDDEDTSAVRSIILLLALSLDCLFEGLSLGLMRTSPAVWNMFIAIATHESVVVFTMGLELVKVHPPKRVLLIAVLFGLMCPIGGAIGTCIMEIQGTGDALAMAAGILQALTAGMFIYVTFFQILNGEISGHSSLSKLVAMVIGFACMAALVAVPGASPTPYEDSTGHLLDPLAQNVTASS